MARKRKIPARKHHGIRDPLKQLEEKEKKLKHVVNSPPTKSNDQQASYKFMQFKKLSDQVKAGKKVKRIRSGIEDKPKADRSKNAKNSAAPEGNKFKNIKQMPGEGDADYLRRVNRITTASLKEAQYEAKYGVKVIRDSQTGSITVKKQPLNEIDELLKQKRKEMRGGKIKKKNQAKSTKPLDPKLAKELIKQAIAEDEQEKRLERQSSLVEYQRDEVKFGEIVHAPPSISTLPRRAEKTETVPRPGKKNNLLLKSLLPDEATSKTLKAKTTEKTKTAPTAEVTKAQRKGKRKDLPQHTREMLESERQKFIDLYRNIKKTRLIQGKSNAEG